ncbi:hypothetical protein IFR05_015735 [Cadophora sp. M221]|nr:hypothetical protein IFR05_015735 [Cadophora sp. M221]
MPAKTPTKDSRPVDSRPCPPSFDPSEGSATTPTPSKKKKSATSIVKAGSAKVTPDNVSKSASMAPFRHKWMKKVNAKGVPFGEIDMTEDLDANTNEDGKKTPKRVPMVKAKTVEFSPDVLVDVAPAASTLRNMEAEFNPVTPRRDEGYDSDGEIVDAKGGREEAYMDSEGNIGQFVPRAMNTMEKARRKIKTEEGVTDPNGRQVGRKLVLWHRPRMMEKLILHMQYECHKQGLQVPWDSIVHRLNPGSSGPSATQMLNKLRDVLITEGHMIPPVLGKAGSAQDPTLRGYTRDMSSNIPTATMAVRWTDDITDRKENLVVPGLIRGSGKYRKVPKSELVPVPKVELKPGERRNRKPAEVDAWNAEQRAVRESEKKARAVGRAARGPSSRSSRVKKEFKDETDSEIDPAELDSDDDYNPEVKKKSSSRRKKIVNDWSSPNPYTSPTPKSRKRSAKKALGDNTEEEHATPNSLVVKFRLTSGGLKNFKAGVSGKKPKDIEYFEPARLLFQDDTMKDVLRTEVAVGDDPKNTSYMGPELHGDVCDFMKAVADGKDPRINGLGFDGDGEKISAACEENSTVLRLLSDEDAETLRIYRERKLAQSIDGLEQEIMDVSGGDQNDEVDQGEYDVEASDNEGEEASFDDDDDHHRSSFHQLSSQSFSDEVLESNSFASHETSFDDQLDDDFQPGEYSQAGFDAVNNGDYQNNYAQIGMFQSYGTPSQNNGQSIDANPFLHSQGAIFEDDHDPFHNNFTNDWQPERSESPAPYTRYASRSYEFEGNNENNGASDAFMDGSEVTTPRDVEGADGFNHF